MSLMTEVVREDILWSQLDDFTVVNGDLADTRSKSGLGFLEEVEIRLKSAIGDWKLDGEKGASIIHFEGRINNEKTWGEISDAISHTLSHDLFLYATQFEVFIIPLSEDEIAIRIDFNKELGILLDEEIPSIKLVYSLVGHQPYVMR